MHSHNEQAAGKTAVVEANCGGVLSTCRAIEGSTF